MPHTPSTAKLNAEQEAYIQALLREVKNIFNSTFLSEVAVFLQEKFKTDYPGEDHTLIQAKQFKDAFIAFNRQQFERLEVLYRELVLCSPKDEDGLRTKIASVFDIAKFKKFYIDKDKIAFGRIMNDFVKHADINAQIIIANKRLEAKQVALKSKGLSTQSQALPVKDNEVLIPNTPVRGSEDLKKAIDAIFETIPKRFASKADLAKVKNHLIERYIAQCNAFYSALSQGEDRTFHEMERDILQVFYDGFLLGRHQLENAKCKINEFWGHDPEVGLLREIKAFSESKGAEKTEYKACVKALIKCIKSEAEAIKAPPSLPPDKDPTKAMQVISRR